MPQPNDPLQSKSTAEDSYLDLLIETLEGMDEAGRGQFLRQLFHILTQAEVTESQSNKYWDLILTRRRELAGSLGRRVSLKTAMVDVLMSVDLLRVPVLMEYDDFKKLKINAATDALTGLYNRRLFDEYCDKELNRAKRYSHHLAVVILDLHKLKEVNDRHGHLQGDNVLQLAASTLSTTLRASDFAFRIGGDEFALLLPQTDLEQAVTLCRRVRAQYESEVRPLNLDAALTLDFGVAVHPEDGDQKSELMGLADKELYELKNSGRTSRRAVQAEKPPAVTPQGRPTIVPNPAPADPRPLAAPAAAPEAPVAPVAPQNPEPAPRVARGPEQRKWERVALSGTKAHAILTDLGQKVAKVVDLSYGGVALLMQGTEEIPTQFNAVLHVPILPPVRVVLRTTYTSPAADSFVRVGCAFVS